MADQIPGYPTGMCYRNMYTLYEHDDVVSVFYLDTHTTLTTLNGSKAQTKALE